MVGEFSEQEHDYVLYFVLWGRASATMAQRFIIKFLDLKKKHKNTLW